jgi:hypothetical protein
MRSSSSASSSRPSFAVAELLLDRLHLLVEIVLALGLLHLPLDAERMRFSTCSTEISLP